MTGDSKRQSATGSGKLLPMLGKPGAILRNYSAAVITTAAVILGAAATTGVVVTIRSSSKPTVSATGPGSPEWHRRHPVLRPPLPTRPESYVGVYEPASPHSYGGMQLFGRTVGRTPNLALYYSGWWEPFKTVFAKEAYAAGAITIVQIDPSNPPHNTVSIKGIARGEYNSYLISYADQVANFGHPVVIGFGHEPDGYWYPWGDTSIAPSVWVAAYRHVVNVFRMQGADNVTWLWTVNVLGKQIHPLSAYWPGRSYVNWAGIDGYYTNPRNTYVNVFGPTIASISLIAPGIPILISETAVGSVGTEPEQIADMYKGIHSYGDLGLIWFDMNAPGQPYRLEGDTEAVRVFERLIKPWPLVYGR